MATLTTTIQYLLLSTFAVIVFLSDASVGLAQQRVIELQIISDSRAQVGTQQKWMEALQDVGADRVVVKTGGVSKPTIEELQLSSSTLITITGIIKGSRLLLPGGSFAITDKSGIRQLIGKFRDDGAKIALAEKKAFGLTSEQLIRLHGSLSKPVNFNTHGINVGAAVVKISALIDTEITYDVAARRALAGSDLLTEELNGISAGTALAIAVRPLGLVLQPQRLQGRELELKIVDAQQSTENWPVGWPLEKPPVQIEPKLFERLALEIRGFPLSDALDAIEQRTGVPFFYDLNSFAREGIELNNTKVTLVQDKASFMVAIGKLLRQSKPKLIEELRVDENGKPFLWITTQ